MVIRISDDLFRGRYKTISDFYEKINSNDPIQISSWNTLKLGAILLLVFVEIVLRGSWAASVAFADTIIWVAIVFSTAGPMILSGLYEATLDRKVIEKIQLNELQFLASKDQKTPDLYLRIHLLYAVLVGNLELNYPEDDSEGRRSAWDDVKTLVYRTTDKNSIQIRLKGMLGCQASFGAAIGAPVVFFLGSFFFSVFSDLSTVGDNDTSHALAFGMWWMTIPHVAIVAGCLLAGNNPNTLEVIVCGLTSWPSEAPEAPEHYESSYPVEKLRIWMRDTLRIAFFARPNRRTHFWHYLDLYRPFYDSVYQPVWMWERGRSKRTWIRQVERYYDNRRLPEGEMEPLKSTKNYVRYQKWDYDNFNVGVRDWIYIIVVTLVLMATPLILAFLTSFYTPTVGLSCRSFTFLMYFIFQFLISLIWLWDFQYEERSPLTQDGTRLPSSYCVIMSIGLAGSLFTTIAGTFLQILGVYRNCLCRIPISAWSSGNYSIVVSTNSADDIKYAEHFWLPTGITSIVALILVCYVGWWYQRHWRRRFTVVIDKYLWRDKKSSLNVVSSSIEKTELMVEERPIRERNGAGFPPEIREI
jgi:hypothetical protein